MKSNVQQLSSFFTIHLMYKGMIVLPVNAISLTDTVNVHITDC